VGSRQRLAALIAAEHPEPYREDLRTITGARSDLEIAEWIDELVRRELGCGTSAALFGGKSVGAVFGLELTSGERVVLKLFHPMFPPAELQAMQRCLEGLVARGFPAPPPRTPLFRADDRITGGFYAYRDGELADGHAPDVRRELARSLAELARLTADVEVPGLPLSPARGPTLWATPHRSFDSNEPSPATDWIDEVARSAQAVVRGAAAALQPVHLDWGVKNVRFRDGRVCAVYDWDSLAAGSEAEMVGRASAEFPTQWERPRRRTPTIDESAAYVGEYEQARGQAFTAEERAVADASADYLVAQVARQEDPGTAAREGSFTALLRERTQRARR
jgi:Phosphotransferase enzyme family